MGHAKNYQSRKNKNIRNQEKKSSAYQPRIPFRTIEGIGTEAWNQLDLGAIGLLTAFYKKFNGHNRRNLSVTFREMKHKTSSLVFTRWQWQLIGFGFIDVIRQGRLERNCSLYGLSNRWRKLTKKPELLDEIEGILKEIEKLKREKGCPIKRMRIHVLRKRILKLGKG